MGRIPLPTPIYLIGRNLSSNMKIFLISLGTLLIVFGIIKLVAALIAHKKGRK